MTLFKKTNVRRIKNQYEFIEQPDKNHLWNDDIGPTPISDRTWNKWHIAGLWIAMSISIPAYMLGASMISNGMNWWQATLTVLIGSFIVLIPMLLISAPGVKYGIPFPVLARSSFGIEGAKLAALLRALVACGWFGIQTTVGGNALYFVLTILFPSLKNSPSLGSFIGLNLLQLICIILFWFIQLSVFSHGMNMIKKLSTFAAPILLICSIVLFCWAWYSVGSLREMFAATYLLGTKNSVNFWVIFFPSMTAVVGFWSTLALNIPDFMRFAKSQNDQVIGQAVSLPFTMVLFTFIGIIVTGATIILFGKALWDPTYLLNHFSNPFVLILFLFCILLATACCNITANLVSPGNDFSTLLPKYISFKSGAYIAGILGIIIMPWKLIADPSGYIYKWLVAYSALLGAIGGIMICDFYLIRKKRLCLNNLFLKPGNYYYSKGWNKNAIWAFILAIIPNIPGFLLYIGLLNSDALPVWIEKLYDYAWFLSFGIAFLVYWLLMRNKVNYRYLKK